MASPEPQHIQKNLSCSTKAFAVLRSGFQPQNIKQRYETNMDIPSTPLAQLKDPSLLKTAALVNGQWLDGSNRFDVNDPATGLKLADVANLAQQTPKPPSPPPTPPGALEDQDSQRTQRHSAQMV